MVRPADNAPVPARHHVLKLEERVWRGAEEALPERPYRCLAFIAHAVRRWIGVLEDTIFSHYVHHGVNVVPVDSIIEPIYSFKRGPRSRGLV